MRNLLFCIIACLLISQQNSSYAGWDYRGRKCDKDGCTYDVYKETPGPGNPGGYMRTKYVPRSGESGCGGKIAYFTGSNQVFPPDAFPIVVDLATAPGPVLRTDLSSQPNAEVTIRLYTFGGTAVGSAVTGTYQGTPLTLETNIPSNVGWHYLRVTACSQESRVYLKREN